MVSPEGKSKHFIPVGAYSGVTNACVLFTILPDLAQIPFSKGCTYWTRVPYSDRHFEFEYGQGESLSH